MIIGGNPPRCNEDFVISTSVSAPEKNHHRLHDVIDTVIAYFGEVWGVHVISAFPFLLGLCLIKFGSTLTKQAMINHSRHILSKGREIILEEHDRGLNRWDSSFSRTCWNMLLWCPLDYQTKDYIQLAINHFGTIMTWTNNSDFKSRVIVRCSVLHISKISRSIIVFQASWWRGGARQSWTVPIFVLDSQNNAHISCDEDPIPYDCNPHPLPCVLNQQPNPRF